MTRIDLPRAVVKCDCGRRFTERRGHAWRFSCLGCGCYAYPMRNEDGSWSAHCVQCHYPEADGEWGAMALPMASVQGYRPEGER